MGFNLLLGLLTCYSSHGGQKLSLVVRLSGCPRVEEVRRPSPCAGKSLAPGLSFLLGFTFYPPLSALSAGPLAEARSTPWCPHVLQSSALNSLYLDVYALWRLELLEQRHLGSLETKAGSSPQRGLRPWPRSPEE